MNIDIDTIWKSALELSSTYLPKVTFALLTLIAGLWIVKFLVGAAHKVLAFRKIDPSLSGFLLSLLSILGKVIVFLTVAGMLGVETTSLVALLGAAGLAVGMALSSTLQNFAGGVMILLFKPFQVGDLIEGQGYLGTVKEIQIFNTILITPDQKTIIIPNAPLSSESMVNYSSRTNRRVDLVIGIGYEDDIDKAKQVIATVVNDCDDVLSEPESLIVVGELADSSVNLFVRPWCKTDKYWDVKFKLLEEIKKALDANGISIPFPQRDVHLRQVANN